VQTRFLAVAAFAALAALATGCSANDEPADPAATTTTVAALPTTASERPTTTSAGGETGSNAQVISVTVSGGKVTPPPGPVEVKLGSTVALLVLSDVADEVHVHGYDQKVDAQPGQPAQLQFTANIPGQFEVELEAKHLLLLELRVS
jgi:heme/copper-type cytochrome/quinol oxidase subunit 2